MDRGSEQGAVSLLGGLMPPRQPASHDSHECEAPCQVAGFGGFYRGRGTELYRSQEKIPMKAK